MRWSWATVLSSNNYMQVLNISFICNHWATVNSIIWIFITGHLRVDGWSEEKGGWQQQNFVLFGNIKRKVALFTDHHYDTDNEGALLL